jgi:hypothetical protein
MEVTMSLNQNWYTIDEVESKYGIHPLKLQQWVENGLIRTEDDEGVTRFNGDDVEQEISMVPSV